MRGNRATSDKTYHLLGPIPACAGQPRSAPDTPQRCWAYPRVCGATGVAIAGIATLAGLSPRVRGNHSPAGAEAGQIGPIPACAGQPPARTLAACPFRAYPRVCGATEKFALPVLLYLGLSPRVRGNLVGFDGV